MFLNMYDKKIDNEKENVYLYFKGVMKSNKS